MITEAIIASLVERAPGRMCTWGLLDGGGREQGGLPGEAARLDLEDSEQLLLCVPYMQEDPSGPRPRAHLGIRNSPWSLVCG